MLIETYARNKISKHFVKSEIEWKRVAVLKVVTFLLKVLEYYEMFVASRDVCGVLCPRPPRCGRSKEISFRRDRPTPTNHPLPPPAAAQGLYQNYLRKSDTRPKPTLSILLNRIYIFLLIFLLEKKFSRAFIKMYFTFIKFVLKNDIFIKEWLFYLVDDNIGNGYKEL